MKKTMIFVLCGILLINATACRTAGPNIEDTTAEQFNEQTAKEIEEGTVTDTVEKQTEEETVADTVKEQTEADTNHEHHSGFIMYADMEELLRAEWERRYEQSNEAGMNNPNSQLSVMVPVLIRSDYELAYINAEGSGDTVLEVAYDPIDRAPGNYEDRIYLKMYLDTRFQDHLEENYGFNPEKDAIKYMGEWFIGLDGYCCSVQMPNSMYDEEFGIPLEKVYEYFDFEIITYSPTAETDATQ